MGSLIVLRLVVVSIFMSVLWYRAVRAEQIAAERLVTVERESHARRGDGHVHRHHRMLQPEYGLGTETPCAR